MGFNFTDEEIVIEIANKDNGYLIFSPLGNQRLRGRWSFSNVAGTSMHESLASLASIPAIPGIRLAVNPVRRTIRRFDPLATPEGAEAMRVVNQLASKYTVLFGVDRLQAWPEYKLNDATDDQVKTWLYWMRRTVDEGNGEIVRGNLPTLSETIELPGRRRRVQGIVHQDESEMWTDERPSRAELVGAGAAAGGAAGALSAGGQAGGQGGGKGGRGGQGGQQ